MTNPLPNDALTTIVTTDINKVDVEDAVKSPISDDSPIANGDGIDILEGDKSGEGAPEDKSSAKKSTTNYGVTAGVSYASALKSSTEEKSQAPAGDIEIAKVAVPVAERPVTEHDSFFDANSDQHLVAGVEKDTKSVDKLIASMLDNRRVMSAENVKVTDELFQDVDAVGQAAGVQKDATVKDGCSVAAAGTIADAMTNLQKSEIVETEIPVPASVLGDGQGCQNPSDDKLPFMSAQSSMTGFDVADRVIDTVTQVSAELVDKTKTWVGENSLLATVGVTAVIVGISLFTKYRSRPTKDVL